MRWIVVVAGLAACGRLDFQPLSRVADGGTDATIADARALVCGNNVIDVAIGETCDDGNVISGDGCSATCQASELCGNGVVDSGEACDSMNTFTATCDPDCTAPLCGDGAINMVAGEQCDDANSVSSDACVSCRFAVCGDGFVHTGVEQCDLGGGNSNAPNATCRPDCNLRRCGDGIVDTLSGETCDDGNTTNGDGCNSTCTGP